MSFNFQIISLDSIIYIRNIFNGRIIFIRNFFKFRSISIISWNISKVRILNFLKLRLTTRNIIKDRFLIHIRNIINGRIFYIMNFFKFRSISILCWNIIKVRILNFLKLRLTTRNIIKDRFLIHIRNFFKLRFTTGTIIKVRFPIHIRSFFKLRFIFLFIKFSFRFFFIYNKF